MKIIIFLLSACLFMASCSAKKTSSTSENGNTAIGENKPLEGTYWQLIELNGQPVSTADTDGKPSYIYFETSKKRVGVSGGCNVMGGSYDLLDGNQIKFGNLMSTMMACPDMTNENGLKKMAEMVDNYAIQGDNLMFAKAKMAPVARFKASVPPAGLKLD